MLRQRHKCSWNQHWHPEKGTLPLDNDSSSFPGGEQGMSTKQFYSEDMAWLPADTCWNSWVQTSGMPLHKFCSSHIYSICDIQWIRLIRSLVSLAGNFAWIWAKQHTADAAEPCSNPIKNLFLRALPLHISFAILFSACRLAFTHCILHKTALEIFCDCVFTFRKGILHYLTLISLQVVTWEVLVAARCSGNALSEQLRAVPKQMSHRKPWRLKPLDRGLLQVPLEQVKIGTLSSMP